MFVYSFRKRKNINNLALQHSTIFSMQIESTALLLLEFWYAC